MKFAQKMYSLFVWYIFKTAAIKKKSHYGFKAYPCPNILIPLAKWAIQYNICFHTIVKKFFFLKFNAKKGAKLFPPPPPLNF